MENEDEDPLRAWLIVILIIVVGFLLVTLLTYAIPRSGAYGFSHPPQVDIIRNGSQVDVIYEGGIDNGFVGDFRISDGAMWHYFKKPEYAPGYVGSVKAANDTCIKVEAIDLAVQSYRAIGKACI